MRIGLGIRIAITLVVVFLAVVNCLEVLSIRTLPFNLALDDRDAMVIKSVEGIPLPSPLVEGDRIDLRALDPDAREALAVQYVGRTFPAGHTYNLTIDRAESELRVPVTTVPQPALFRVRWIQAAAFVTTLLMATMTLLLIWRGQDIAAAALAVWNLGYLAGFVGNWAPADGPVGVGLQFFGIVAFIGARVGFFVMADALAGPLLSGRLRYWFRALFALIAIVGGLQPLVALVALASTGWVELSRPEYTVLFSWIYLVPVVLLFVGYRASPAVGRVRLRWVLLCAITVLVAVTLTNYVPFGFLGTSMFAYWIFTLAVIGLAYALLRYRVVDVSVVVDRALVYGLVTTLVVGVIAAVNSVALRLALPAGAGLVVQVIIPLALGIVLGRVREYADRIVERVFFRRKYKAESALRNFARHVGYIEEAPRLLDAALREIRRNVGTPAAAVYTAEGQAFRLLKAAGEGEFPERVENDDSALVVVRAEHKAVELSEYASAIGEDGVVLPMLVLGNLRGVIVCHNRAGEHYAADEKKLLARVAREVGAALRILRAKDNEALVAAMAQGSMTPDRAFAEARRLSLAWVGS